MRHRTYDPALGRFIQRDPAGYLDGMSLYQYARSSPAVLSDPMGLHPEMDSALAEQQHYIAQVMDGVRSGQIDAGSAGRLINMAGDNARRRIALAETLSNRWDVKLNAGLKANANATIDTIVSFGSFGSVDNTELFSVNAYERGAGYERSYGIARISQEAAFAILTARAPTGLARQIQVFDALSGLRTSLNGLDDASRCGLTWNNAAQIVGGAIGFGSGAKELAARGRLMYDRMREDAERLRRLHFATPLPFSKEKQSLVEMAKRDKRTGMTESDMEAYKQLNDQLVDPFPRDKVRGPESHDSGLPSSRSPHGHVGPVDHIPIRKKNL
jgi:hypothetical protein